jgi:hypothetical protein
MKKSFSKKQGMSSKRQRRHPGPSNSLSLNCTQQIHERYTTTAVSSASILTISYNISPAALLLAGRLAGYQAIADEVRIDFVRTTLTPVLGASSSGRSALYIERDPAAALVATVNLADDQRERVVGRVHQPLQISWRPQEPNDLQFNLLNPGTVSLGKFGLVGDNITDANAANYSGVVYNVQFLVAMTIRGRP